MKTPVTADEFVRIYGLAMRFGLVRRATAHVSGEAESDTTHTVGLAYVALICAQRMGLDVGRVLILALVHDLAEAYAGDVCTAVELSTEARAEKDAREADALQRILIEVPELGRWIRVYEAQGCAESHLVHYLDKMCPKAAHVLDGAAAVVGGLGLSLDQVRTSHAKQSAKLRQAHPQTHLHDLFDSLCARAEYAVALREGTKASEMPTMPHNEDDWVIHASREAASEAAEATMRDLVGPGWQRVRACLGAGGSDG